MIQPTYGTSASRPIQLRLPIAQIQLRKNAPQLQPLTPSGMPSGVAMTGATGLSRMTGAMLAVALPQTAHEVAPGASWAPQWGQNMEVFLRNG